VAPARPYWKGYLRLSLVTCPIALYTGTSSTERVSFRQVNKKTGNRLRQQLVDEVTREPVSNEEKGRGYEYTRNAYILVDDDELDAVAVESTHTIEIDSFVPREQIDERYLDTPYYVAPEGKIGDETFKVLREAMDRSGRAGIGRVVLTSRDHPLVLRPHGKGMVMITLRPAGEVRTDTEYFKDISESKPDEEMVDLALRIIERMSGPFDPKELAGDRYQEALRQLVEQKVKGETPVLPKPAEPGKVINLLDALRQSLEAESAETRTPIAAGGRRGTTMRREAKRRRAS